MKNVRLGALLAAGVAALAIPLAGAAGEEKRPLGSHHVAPPSGIWWIGKAAALGFEPRSHLGSTCTDYIESGANPYGDPRPNVDQIVDDVVNEGVGAHQGCYTPQNETAIAINPTDETNLVGGANDYRFVNPASGRNDGSGGYYYSFDRGKSWGNGFLPGLVKGNPVAPGPFDGAGDPVLAFDADGNVYYSNIAFNRTSPENGIFVNKSTDGGRTFGPPATVTYTEDPDIFNDKEWMTVDTNAASPHKGTVYVTWTQFNLAEGNFYENSPIVLSYSTDGGQTFSPQVAVSDIRHRYNQFSVPVAAPDGTLYVVYQNWATLTSATSRILVSKSTDGGRSFGPPVQVADNIDFPYNSSTGRSALTDLEFRVNSGPAMAVDARTGALYVVWADNRNGTAELTDGDVFVSVSTNGGRSWSPPRRVNTEPAGAYDQVFPWIAVGGDGSVHVGFYDRQFTLTNAGGSDDLYLDYSYAKSTNGGKTFSTTAKVTTQASDPYAQFDGLFIGDYTAVAADARGRAYLSWTDNRGNPGTTPPNQDAYFQLKR